MNDGGQHPPAFPDVRPDKATCGRTLGMHGTRHEGSRVRLVSRSVGTIVERNTFTNCDVAIRLGTGSAGTVMSANQTVNCKALWTDAPSHAGLPTSSETLLK